MPVEAPHPRYDEWALARTPELLRLALAATGDHARAEAACRRALTRAAADWPRLARADPDLAVRRQLLQGCDPARAAAALRSVDHRSEAEIAEVLGCSHAAVRRHLRRPGADLLLEAEPPVDLGPLPTATSARRTQAWWWLVVVAVLAVTAGGAWVGHETRSPEGRFSYPSIEIPEGWRAESYAGVQVRVPPTWGWGAAPIRGASFSHHLGACGTSTAATAPGSTAYVSSATPFVGRPAVLSDLCMSWGSDGVLPVADAVWFDSPLPVGQRGEGSRTAETRELGGQHVTVFSADGHLRRQILGSAEVVGTDDHGCPSDPVSAPAPGAVDRRPTSLSVCVYSQDSGATVLQWSARADASAASAYLRAVTAADGDRTGHRCGAAPQQQWVALGVGTESGATRWDVVDTGCGRIRTGAGASTSEVAMTPETVAPWSSAGVRAYVAGPPGLARVLGPYFHAPFG